jgi:hypothetical protein
MYYPKDVWVHRIGGTYLYLAIYYNEIFGLSLLKTKRNNEQRTRALHAQNI